MIFHRCYFVDLLQSGLALADSYCPAVIQICRTSFRVRHNCNIYQEKGGRTHEFTRGFTRLRIIISEWRGSVPRRNNFSFEGHSRFHEEMIFLSRGKSRGNSWYPPNFFLVNIIVSQGEGRHVASTVSRPRLKFLFT